MYSPNAWWIITIVLVVIGCCTCFGTCVKLDKELTNARINEQILATQLANNIIELEKDEHMNELIPDAFRQSEEEVVRAEAEVARGQDIGFYIMLYAVYPSGFEYM